MEKDKKDISLIVSVLAYEQGYDNGKETTFYTIRADVNGTDKTIKKRFNKFADLQEKLAKTYDRLPELPAKTLIKLTKAIDLEKRRAALEKYLKVL